MAPPSMRIRTLALVVVQALLSTVVHAGLQQIENCPRNCDRFGSSLRAVIQFGALAVPWGYEQISAVCPGNAQAQNCPRIPLYFTSQLNPPETVFKCCDVFTIVTGSGSNVFPASASVFSDASKITVDGYRLENTQDGLRINCNQVKQPFLVHGFGNAPDQPARITSIDLCYNPLSGPTPPPPSQPPPPPPGSVTGDPKVVGGDGVAFYFHGRKDHDFCLVTDSDLHINAHFIGKRPAGRTRDFTWVQALGFVYGSHALTIAAKRNVAHWDSAIDHLEFVYNGEALTLNPASSWASPGAAMILARMGAANEVDLEIKEKMGVSLKAVPVGKHESDVHHYGITGDDCFLHFDMQFRFHNLSTAVDGFLGQTYRPGFVSPVKRGVAMPVMGGADRFGSSSLLATDCAVSQYTLARGSSMPIAAGACGSSGLPDGVPGGITCRR